MIEFPDGQLQAESKYHTEVDIEWARHDAEEERLQVAYKIQCDKRTEDILMSIDAQVPTGWWYAKVTQWGML